MKLVTALLEGSPCVGIVQKKEVLFLDEKRPLHQLLTHPINTQNIQARHPLAEVKLLPPIQPQRGIFCLGLNYKPHIEEVSLVRGQAPTVPKHPVVFTKAPQAITGAYDPIPYEAGISDRLDWEVELAVVIGKAGRKISVEQALDHIFGYTILNDITLRDVQKSHKQYYLGKSWEAGSPLGPYLVTKDEIPDPQNLDLHCWVNGDLKQSSNTRHHIFPIAETIAILSRTMTLLPGDIISTGTPGGVGFGRTPPEYLRPDDLVVCEVAGIGRQENKVVVR